ncbi:DUF1800 domain-containing protein [bacterium]|nr:DUF1800 domain-containing protein [bacterium]
MTTFNKATPLLLGALLVAAPASAGVRITIAQSGPVWRQAGLTERQAAAHLLDRFTFGPRPGDVDRVVETGLEEWLEGQLRGDLPEPDLDRRLSKLEPLGMSLREMYAIYPGPGQVQGMARRAGVYGEDEGGLTQRERRGRLQAYMRDNGLRPQQELVATLYANRILGAIYAENQVHQVLSNFWFNHFYVTITDNQVRGAVLAYERDAIRPHSLGLFRDLLGATAKHPAMLLYLDNAMSTAGAHAMTTMEMALEDYNERIGREGGRLGMAGGLGGARGINENYARELMELHTLGVDGGYTQEDVGEVSRILSGWTVLPDARHDLLMRRVREGSGLGFVVEGDFLFRADAHDAGAKTVLGVAFPEGGGMEEGEALLDILATHPSTAAFIARKFAVRFVSDNPPQALVDRLSQSFLASGGDTAALVRTLFASPGFWAPEAVRAKVKSPFEVAVSALRALDAEVGMSRDLVHWLDRMGQPLYRYPAPTGWPDRASAWVNTGALLNRMNFGLALAAGRIRGVEVDLQALNTYNGVFHEPESAAHALEIYAALLMPGRDLDDTLRILGAVVTEPGFADSVAAAADGASGSAAVSGRSAGGMAGGMGGGIPGMDEADRSGHRDSRHDAPSILAQVVGLILGSPEFQRR